MRAVRLHGIRDLRVEEVDFPPLPKAGEVTLRVTAAGICGSDLHNFATGAWMTRVPSIAGHEFTGVVSAIGPDVEHVAPCNQVAVDSRLVCGSCASCSEGLSQICENLGFLGEVIDGGFAEYVTLPARNVIQAPAHLQPRHLALAEPLAVALHAVSRLNAPKGAEVLVTGAGAIGALCALVLALKGHSVLIADRNASRAARAAEAAAGRVVTLDALPQPAPRYALDATGSAEVLGSLLEKLRGGGAVALAGIGSRSFDFNPTLLVEREISLIGCHAFADELPKAVELIADLGERLDLIIDSQITLDQVPMAYEMHLSGAIMGAKTIILPEAEL